MSDNDAWSIVALMVGPGAIMLCLFVASSLLRICAWVFKSLLAKESKQ